MLNLTLNSIYNVLALVPNLLTLISFNTNININMFNYDTYTAYLTTKESVKFQTSSITPSSSGNEDKFSDSTTYGRFLRFSNPLISYDYKCGNYLGI
jgi:hypothetical protein